MSFGIQFQPQGGTYVANPDVIFAFVIGMLDINFSLAVRHALHNTVTSLYMEQLSRLNN